MVLNKKYEIYNGMNKESEVTKPKDVNYARFEIKGKPDFGLLKELQKDGFRELAPILRKFEVAKETYAYSSNSTMIILYVNRKTHYHEVDITLKNEGVNNPEKIDFAKSLLEKILGFELIDPTKSTSDLIEEVGEN